MLTPFVLKILTLVSSLFVSVEKRLDQKSNDFKIYDVINWIQIFPNISGGKGNQAMKFGHLREYNMKNTFLEKSQTKCSGETSPN